MYRHPSTHVHTCRCIYVYYLVIWCWGFSVLRIMTGLRARSTRSKKMQFEFQTTQGERNTVEVIWWTHDLLAHHITEFTVRFHCSQRVNAEIGVYMLREGEENESSAGIWKKLKTIHKLSTIPTNIFPHLCLGILPSNCKKKKKKKKSSTALVFFLISWIFFSCQEI